EMRQVGAEPGVRTVEATHHRLGRRWLVCLGDHELLFTDNETDNALLFHGENPTPYVKNGIDRYVVQGEAGAVNPGRTGTKAALDCVLDLPPGGSATVRVRLADQPDGPARASAAEFDAIVEVRRAEADEFYTDLFGSRLGEPEQQ